MALTVDSYSADDLCGGEKLVQISVTVSVKTLE